MIRVFKVYDLLGNSKELFPDIENSVYLIVKLCDGKTRHKDWEGCEREQYEL